MPDEYLAGPPPDSPEDRAWMAEHIQPFLKEEEHEPLFEPLKLAHVRHAGNEGVYDLEIQVARIRTLAELPDDWDSYGAQAPTQRAIDTACDVLTAVYARLGWRVEGLERRGFELIIGPEPSGVVLIWDKGAGSLDLCVADSGKLTWMEISRQPLTIKAKGEVGDDVGAWADEVLATFLQTPTPEPPVYGGEYCG